MPPCTCSADAVACHAASPASALATDAANGSRPGSWSAVHAALSTAERALSTSISMSAHRCDTAW